MLIEFLCCIPALMFKSAAILSLAISLYAQSVYSSDELDLLYKEVMAEAGGDGSESQQAVTTVILNREESPDYPDNITDVIGANGQFCDPSSYYTDEVVNSVNMAIFKYGTSEQIIPYNCYYFRAGHYHSFGIPYTNFGNTYFSLSEEASL